MLLCHYCEPGLGNVVAQEYVSCFKMPLVIFGKTLNFRFLLQVCGIKAPSPLLQLPSFDVINGIAIDAMHCVYLGVVKQLVGLWFNSKHSDQRWYCGSRVEMVDKRLLEIKPPTVITRIPRSIQYHVKFWKGNQLMRHKLKLYYLVHLSVSCWVEGESVFDKCKEK